MTEAALGLEAAILGEIASRGPIPFARFMQICLYHEPLGYYSRGAGGGGGRDYVTSSGLHSAFGALVLRQAEEMWRGLDRPARFDFVEFGPGEGWFARDFLTGAARRAGFSSALRYRLVERSPALGARQRARLEGLAAGEVRWATEDDLESERPIVGCLFANELLDAFPVHRVIGTPGGPREIHVASGTDGRLEEVLRPPSTPAIEEFLEASGIALRVGQEVDLNLEAPRFIERAIGRLARGYLMVIDYGFEARELYDPARWRGTLRAYHRHRVHDQVLLRPGDQDLTAHVDFTALKRAAESAGGHCIGLTTQARFLLALGALEFLPDPGRPDGRGAGAGDAVARLQEREALKEMVLPDRMGERFRVLIVAVGEVPSALSGLGEPWAAATRGAAQGAVPPAVTRAGQA